MINLAENTNNINDGNQVSSGPNTLFPLPFLLIPKVRGHYWHDNDYKDMATSWGTFMLEAGLISSESIPEDWLPVSPSKTSVPEYSVVLSMTAETEFEGDEKLYSWALEKQSP